MKLLVFADLHFIDYLKWREFLQIDHSLFDAVLLLGDIETLLLKSIQENLSDKPLAGILGNHDYVGDLEYYDIPNLHGKAVKLRDVQFIGVEGCIRYKKGKAPLHEQEDITNMLRGRPYVDVVLSHNSPKGIHDKADKAHEGYEGLINYMDDNSPRYLLHGHQHINKRTLYKQTEVIGIYGGVIFNTQTGETITVLDLEQE